MKHPRIAVNCLLILTALGIWYGVLHLYSRQRAISYSNDAADVAMSTTNFKSSKQSEQPTARRNPREKLSISDVGLDFFSKDPPGYITIGLDRVGTDGLELLGIDQSKRPAIQEIFEDAWAEAEQGMKARLEFIEDESDPANGVFVYRIPSDRNTGEAILNNLTNRLVGLLGEQNAVRFLAGVNPFARFAGFGIGEAQIRFAPPDNPSLFKGTVPMVVEYSVYNPVTRSRVYSSVGDPNGSFVRSLGGIADELLPK